MLVNKIELVIETDQGQRQITSSKCSDMKCSDISEQVIINCIKIKGYHVRINLRMIRGIGWSVYYTDKTSLECAIKEEFSNNTWKVECKYLQDILIKTKRDNNIDLLIGTNKILQ